MMSLSALIHKNKSGQVATLTVATAATQDNEDLVTVAKVASVTVANFQESRNTVLSVVCYTPAGNPIIVKARDAEHAAFLLNMNPKPAHNADPI
jgi:hypothetical protein